MGRMLAAVPQSKFEDDTSPCTPATKTRSLKSSGTFAIAADTLFTPHSQTLGEEFDKVLSQVSCHESMWCCSGRLRCKILRFVESIGFDLTISTCIFLNALIIGAQTNYMIHNIGEEAPSFFAWVEVLFVIIFTLELLLRIIAYGGFFFTTSDWLWNLYDAVIVVLQV